MIDKQQITNLAEEKLNGTDKFLLEVDVKPGNKISVILDSDSSINIDDCIQLSRHIESSLDRDTEDFELNVSSAGLDQPLKLLRQYQKYLNKDVAVLTTEGKKFKGILNKVNENHIQLFIPANKNKKIKEQELEFLFDQIKETKGIISFKRK